MKPKRAQYILSIIIFSLTLGFWIFQLLEIVAIEQFNRSENYLGSIGIYLFSWFFIFLSVNFLAWLNFRFVFLSYKNSFLPTFLFISIELALMALVFKLLQWNTHNEAELMKDNLSVTLFIALYFLAFCWILELIHIKRRQGKVLQQKERAELMLLQSQLNPHFLFNALNTTYSTAIAEDSPKTAQQILQISDLMRFALDKSNMDFISMEDEIGFLEKYIQLQKDRFHHFGDEGIQIQINWDEIEVPISPMLIQPFLENAFKFTHFGLIGKGAKLNLELIIESGQLKLIVENSYLENQIKENKGTGKGIQLVRQRLETLYPHKHHLLITNSINNYKVFLRIDLKK